MTPEPYRTFTATERSTSRRVGVYVKRIEFGVAFCTVLQRFKGSEDLAPANSVDLAVDDYEWKDS